MAAFDTVHARKVLSELQRQNEGQSQDFRLHAPLAESEVLTFERAYDVTLPPDYREFLIKIGNGGAGPFYGFFPLGFADNDFEIERWHENGYIVGDLSKPFPFTEGWNDLTGKPDDDLAELITGPEETEYDRQAEAFEKVYWRSELLNGAIPICHMGCALRIYLVVTGPEAGYLWEDRRAEYGGIKPLKLRDGSRATFGSWYTEWLDECLSTARNPK
jgi:hypothetical protein